MTIKNVEMARSRVRVKGLLNKSHSGVRVPASWGPQEKKKDRREEKSGGGEGPPSRKGELGCA